MADDPKPQPKGKFVGLVALIGAGAAAILIPAVQRWEGRENVPYRDIVGIWTVCDGDTKNVTPGDVQTDEECDARLERQLIAHAKPVLACTPGLKDKPDTLAAAISLAYNVGTGRRVSLEEDRRKPLDAAVDGWRGGYCGSWAAVHFRAGNWKGGCNAFLRWNKAGGRVVRGLDNRRRAEWQICMRGL